jgi:nicotinamide-nucleotide amidase
LALSAFEPAVHGLAGALRARGWCLGLAESCTGGLIAAACTSVAGSSDWFERGFVTYSNAAKTELLGVPAALITGQGAVSEAVALAMAEGVLAHAPVDLSLAVTGIAGPGGAVAGKPVGTVWLAWGTAAGMRSERLHLPGNRDAVRTAAVRIALARLAEAAGAAAGLAGPAAAVMPANLAPVDGSSPPRQGA